MPPKRRPKRAPLNPKHPSKQPGVIQAPGNEGPRPDKLRADVDTPARLLADIQEHRIDPRDLTPSQRQKCLLLLANGKHTSAELAAVFKVSPATIRKDLKQLREEIGREVRDWTTEEVVGGMVLAAERYQALAIKQEDPGLAWTIERDKVKLLTELGVIGDKKSNPAIQITIEQLGDRYEKATAMLTQAIDPVLAGMEPDDGDVIDVTPGLTPPPLPLERRYGDPTPGPEHPHGAAPDPSA